MHLEQSFRPEEKVTVFLTDLEIAQCDEAATRAHELVIKNGYRDLTAGGKGSLKNNIQGARAEKAAAKFLQEKWNGYTFEGRKQGDVGSLEIRSTDKPWGGLIVRPRDPSDRKYLLVRSYRHPRYDIVGWLWGWEAKRPEWEKDVDHPISSYFLVPNTKLHNPETLT